MTLRRAAPAQALVATALAALAAAAPPAHAGSTAVLGADGSRWLVAEDAAANGGGLVLRHVAANGHADPRFGQGGRSVLGNGAQRDAPASVRVDAAGRVWMVTTRMAAMPPQPVVARFLPDGHPDPRWGDQGRVQLAPDGMTIQADDLLPLTDGSVLVAGAVTTQGLTRAVVFHLSSDGALDLDFGAGGLWQRTLDGDVSIATSLAAAADGSIVVAVALPEGKAAAELWSLSGSAPVALVREPFLYDGGDSKDLRAEWAGDHWLLGLHAGPTTAVDLASLVVRRAAVSAPLAAEMAREIGRGLFNPFGATAASGALAAEPGEHVPWAWIAVAIAVPLAVVVLIVSRGRDRGESPTERDRRH